MEAKKLYIQTKMGRKCQAHNLKVVGLNPTPPATNLLKEINDSQDPQELTFGIFIVIYYLFSN